MIFQRVLWMALLAVLGVSALVFRVSAAETNAVPAKSGESQERPYKNLSPEEKQWKLKQIRETNGLPPLTAEDMRKLTPEERQAKIIEWRERNAPKFTPAEQAKRRMQINSRLASQISELHKKKANGSITDDERHRLERLEELNARIQHPVGQANGSAPGNPTDKSK